MPYSKDLRIGHGWFNANLSWFDDYLDDMEEELIVNGEGSEQKYRQNIMNEEIELRLNEYITWKVFNGPAINSVLDYDDDPYGYVYHHILILIDKHKNVDEPERSWYRLDPTV